MIGTLFCFDMLTGHFHNITGLNYRPAALTYVVMKVFEHLVLTHLNAITDPLLDPLQFAKRSVDAVNLALHYMLQHLDNPKSYASVLFVDFSSAFNTIAPEFLQVKLSQLSVAFPICWGIKEEAVGMAIKMSDTRTLSTGCVLSQLLFILLFSANDCLSKEPSMKILKFTNNTTMVGFITNGDE